METALQTDEMTVARQRLADGWIFCRFEERGEEAPGLECLQVDESGWESVILPHDWGIKGPFREELPNETGKLPWHGIGWYRKSFEGPELEPGERLLIEFEGAMSHPKVWVNGQLVGEWLYGYNSFIVDATPALQAGDNTLAVRLDNPLKSSRWYPGGGLYRDVWLLRKPAVSVEEWSTFITTPEATAKRAGLVITTTVRNGMDSEREATVRHSILTPDGAVVASVEAASMGLAAGQSDEVCVDLNISEPQLWDIESPVLYTCRTEVLVDGQRMDVQDTAFGIRSIEWTADDGFHLNGRRVQINGVCQHHDLGALGAAFNYRAAERQLEILQEMGCNAIRMAHNPPAPALLDLCDRMGFLVVNELFDIWAISKAEDDYGWHFEDWHERDVCNWVCRDRNHPSIIAWSLGNEILEQEDLPGNHDRARRLVELTHQYDRTRPTTVGMNNGESLENGFADIFDVAGYNYKAVADKSPNYQTHLDNYPRLPLYGAETASCLSSRGFYAFPVSRAKDGGFFDYQVSSYNLYSPWWAYPPDVEFDSLDRFPQIAGEFVWTGFDYLGEPTPYNSDKTNALNFANEEVRRRAMAQLDRLGRNAPSRSSYFGILDLAGFPKDRYYQYKGRWRPDLPIAHLLPHWNWHGREGEVTPVHAYTNGDEAELFLNGESLGKKRFEKGEYRLAWEDVTYAPGKLELVTWRNGKPWATAVRETSGPPARLVATVDRDRIAADELDLAFITIQVLDEANRIVPDACPELNVSVEGAGQFVAADNGDSTDWTPFHSSSRKAFNGLALAIVKGCPGQSGKMLVEITSEGLLPATVRVDVNAGM